MKHRNSFFMMIFILSVFLFFPCSMLWLSGQTDGMKSPTTHKENVLFNGTDFSGWGFYLAEPQLKLADVWSVDPKVKAIICKGKPNGYLYTLKEYTNFRLMLKWRFNPITKQAGNSGVFLRAKGPDKVWPRMIEAQLMSGHAGDFWLSGGKLLETDPKYQDPEKAPTLRRHFKDAEKPAGEWNQYEILCQEGHITLKINGELVNEGTGAEIEAGRICLQSEGVEIQFKDIRLVSLDK
jgi:hypothetical protein